MHDRRAPARFGGHPGYRPRSRFLQGRRTSGPTRYGYRWNFVRGYCAGAVGFGDGAGCVALEGAAPPSSTPAMERAAAVAFCSVPTGNTSCLAVTGVVYPGADSMVCPTTSARRLLGFWVVTSRILDWPTSLSPRASTPTPSLLRPEERR